MLPSSKVVKVMVLEIILNMLVSFLFGLLFMVVTIVIIMVLEDYIPNNFSDWYETHEGRFILSCVLIYSIIAYTIMWYYLHVDTFIYTIGH